MNALCRSVPAGILLVCSVAGQQTAIHTLTYLIGPDSFVPIRNGEFLMGSKTGNADEQPVRRVRITKPFQMSKYEVTQAQWEGVLRNPHGKPEAPLSPSHFKGAERPVETVTWDEVQVFLKALNARDTKYVYRLPTEAEWEYAARAGSAAETVKDLGAVAWHQPNSGGETQPIGQKRPNGWGLHDMLGNVFEWVSDWYSPDGYASVGSVDPQGGPPASYKVYRGCGWFSEPKYCRPAYRAFEFPTQGQYAVGFRLVRTEK